MYCRDAVSAGWPCQLFSVSSALHFVLTVGVWSSRVVCLYCWVLIFYSDLRYLHFAAAKLCSSSPCSLLVLHFWHRVPGLLPFHVILCSFWCLSFASAFLHPCSSIAGFRSCQSPSWCLVQDFRGCHILVLDCSYALVS